MSVVCFADVLGLVRAGALWKPGDILLATARVLVWPAQELLVAKLTDTMDGVDHRY